MNLFFISSTVLVMAGIIDNVLNGLARPTFGWVSDHIGRENTMAIVFTCGPARTGRWARSATRRGRSSITPGLVYFTWGEIYSLFPRSAPTCYGPRYATTNAGLLYTAKGAASFVVPLASWLQKRYGGLARLCSSLRPWRTSPSRATALFVVKPMRTSRRRKRRGSPFRRREVGQPRELDDPTRLAAEIAAAYRDRRTISTLSSRAPAFDVDAAYAVDAELVKRRRAERTPTVGLKVGFANKAVWRALKLETLVWAHMYDDTVHYADAGSATLSIAGMISPKIEPEIVFRLPGPFDAGTADAAACCSGRSNGSRSASRSSTASFPTGSFSRRISSRRTACTRR